MTKCNPADRDERGHYIGREDTDSDYGPVEAAYLDTVAAFGEDTGEDVLQIREPSVPIVTGIGSDIHERFGGLVELFGADLVGYHDGARLQLDHADAAFWADLAGLVDELGTALLEGCGLRRTGSRPTATIAAPRLHDRAPRQPHGGRGAPFARRGAPPASRRARRPV